MIHVLLTFLLTLFPCLAAEVCVPQALVHPHLHQTHHLDKMDADHLHELQLGGIDQLSALMMLDKSVNRSMGSQIRHQLKKMPEGTKITRVMEKGK